jgi:hypothetical protein
VERGAGDVEAACELVMLRHQSAPRGVALAAAEAAAVATGVVRYPMGQAMMTRTVMDGGGDRHQEVGE